MKVPLCKNSDILVERPSLGFFDKKIEDKEYFAYTKQLHGFWDGIISAMMKNPKLKNLSHDKGYLKELAIDLAAFKKIHENILYEASMYEDVLNMIVNLNNKPNDFLFGVSDVNLYLGKEPPHSVSDQKDWRKWGLEFTGCHVEPYHNKYDTSFYKCWGVPRDKTLSVYDIRQAMIREFVPQNCQLLDGTIWRKFAYENRRELIEFFAKHKDKRLVVIGPPYYQDFDNKLNLENYEHILIDYYEASKDAHKTIDQIKESYQKDTIYFIVAGTLGVWLVDRMYQDMSEVFVIDAGRALDIFYGIIPWTRMHVSEQKRRGLHV